MKQIIRKSIGALLFAGTLLTFHTATAQTMAVVESPTTSQGTISEFGPEMMIIKSGTAVEPVRYSYSKTTTYVDEAGNPVSLTTVKSGLPVTVYYTKTGDALVATKVIVRKATLVEQPLVEQKKTIESTTTTTSE